MVLYDPKHCLKYERKRSGPFEGMLVSDGNSIKIGGEEFVEYHVLAKLEIVWD
ncbi:uncharacterized protein B0I36DRAFT_316423 [Microdochium trichocladiopsis]|uniref:Uncharacterized protein n=1 Tax=Microdochium trichocladiopsis TaxID=1682393 RepID=A0A9P8YAI4_9PEZI|nr:uncharacterized protein B0I36DRAFT_316423 [Microdochium trichocladiopsis]KAH7034494.1 hypothetical protein B0I36DRAFT_316423 [Microdochium trichocladiopsis]